ncbi:hypothetical protein E2562_025692 [Oryza meyeriana var. granulata]|uniref:Uncharacterized protein n=1 Tax=Oryza meyeriana var. granulata TaxID=110450 RepID=A0A6G1FCF7_9ORYZ|nr:hypothetical protein E2562_025692 [Oryza meyeriana var. granulata]
MPSPATQVAAVAYWLSDLIDDFPKIAMAYQKDKDCVEGHALFEAAILADLESEVIVKDKPTPNVQLPSKKASMKTKMTQYPSASAGAEDEA